MRQNKIFLGGLQGLGGFRISSSACDMALYSRTHGSCGGLRKSEPAKVPAWMGKDHKDSPLTEEARVAENHQRSLFFGRGVGWKAIYTPMDDHTQPHTGALIRLSGL